MPHQLLNGCKSAKTQEIYDRSHQYEAINSWSMGTKVSDFILQNMTTVVGEEILPDEYPYSLDQEYLGIGFRPPYAYDSRDEYSAFILTESDVVILYENSHFKFPDGEEHESTDFRGVFILKDFWNYMNTLPNIKPFLTPETHKQVYGTEQVKSINK